MNRIRELRIKKGLNMQQTAKALNLPYTTYVNYEKGIREPNSEMLINLATFFDVTIDYLIGRVPSVNEIPPIPFDWNKVLSATEELEKLVKSDILIQSEAELLLDFRQLNEQGQAKAKEYINDLVDNVKYAMPGLHTHTQ